MSVYIKAEPPTREQRIARIGELALEWAQAQDEWERAPRRDQAELRRLLDGAEIALERVRVACLALLASKPVSVPELEVTQ